MPSRRCIRERSALEQAITRQEREKAVLEVQEKYASETRQREIDRLTSANRIKQAQLEARTWQQRLFATLAILLGLAAIPLVRWLFRARLANRKLSGDIAVLEEQTLFDPLTGVSNRRHCQLFMAQHLAQGANDPAPIGVMLLDVDFFKRVNDAHGHAVGDSVLVELARRLRALVRQQDAVVRWGGEEFALLLPGTTGEGLTVLAERVLDTIAGQAIDVGGRSLPLTVSIGATVCPLTLASSWEDAMQVADLALYLSKGAGRNRATCVVSVAEGADIAMLSTDLAAAAAAGVVTLSMIVGPLPGHAGVAREVMSG